MTPQKVTHDTVPMRLFRSSHTFDQIPVYAAVLQEFYKQIEREEKVGCNQLKNKDEDKTREELKKNYLSVYLKQNAPDHHRTAAVCHHHQCHDYQRYTVRTVAVWTIQCIQKVLPLLHVGLLLRTDTELLKVVNEEICKRRYEADVGEKKK